jgi:superfamily II DNA/RNA helicase
MLFSATLDGGVDVLARQFMSRPVTHQVDSAQSPPPKMAHHVLHLRHEDRLPVLVDLAASPGRTLVFTRTKHGAKKLTKQLIASGVPAVELHGNLAQNARDRNLRAFSDGVTNTLVATDIAARGIHVDDVALVIHADPPVEHKAYLHRSGRTARAGAAGIVITLTTDDQHREVRDLTRKAGVTPITTAVHPGHAFLAELAPGERSLVAPPAAQPRTASRHGGTAASGNGRGRSAARHAAPGAQENGSGLARGRGATRHGDALPTASNRRGSTRHGSDAAPTSASRRGSTRHATGAAQESSRGVGRHAADAPAGAGSRGIAAFSAQSRAGGRRGSR